MLCLILFSITTRNHGLVLEKGVKASEFDAYSDAHWARDEAKRKPKTGIVLILSGTPFFRSSKLQSSAAMSSSKAELIALFSCVQNIALTREVLDELGLPCDYLTKRFQKKSRHHKVDRRSERYSSCQAYRTEL